MSQSRTGRTLSFALLVALAAALAMWMRSRSRPIQVDDPPEWPPLPPLGGDGEPATVAATPPPAAPDRPAEPTWRPPDDDGACPVGFPIKANDNSGIFHVPGGRFYDRTNPDRCYADAVTAIADGYRQAKS
jgi:hypothetical protein